MNPQNFLKLFFKFSIQSLILFLLLIFITLCLIFIALKSNESISQKLKLQNNISAQTELSLEKNPTLISTDSARNYKENILINTKENKVNSVQVELSFDPNAILVTDIIPGNFFDGSTQLLKTIDQTNGRISYALSPGDENEISGNGIVATIYFSLQSWQELPLNTKVEFLPKTGVSSNSISLPLLKKAYSQNLFFSAPKTSTPSFPIYINSTESAFSTPYSSSNSAK